MAKKQKPKFDWEEFLNKDQKKVIHCETYREAKQCLKLLKEHGLRFRSSIDCYWDRDIPNVCFSNMSGYDRVYYYNQEGTPIYKFSSYDFSED